MQKLIESYFLKFMKTKRKNVKKLSIISIVIAILLYICIPLVLIYKANNILKNEFAMNQLNSEIAPSNQFFIAMNFLRFAVVFPGFSKHSSEIRVDAELRYLGKFKIKCDMVVAEITDKLIKNLRLEKDSVLQFGNTNLIESEKINKIYDKKEDSIRSSTWIEKTTPEDYEKFCNDWKSFIEYIEKEGISACELCK